MREKALSILKSHKWIERLKAENYFLLFSPSLYMYLIAGL